jgi:hypothetical protein
MVVLNGHAGAQAKAVNEMALLLTGGRLGKQTRQVLTDTYKSYVHEQAFNMTAAIHEAVAALDTYLIPQAECNHAVKSVLEIPLPVAATCQASTEFDGRYECANALGGDQGAQWATRSDREGL